MLCKLSYFVYVIIVTVSDKTVHSSLLKERKSFSDKIIRIIITINNLHNTYTSQYKSILTNYSIHILVCVCVLSVGLLETHQGTF